MQSRTAWCLSVSYDVNEGQWGRSVCPVINDWYCYGFAQYQFNSPYWARQQWASTTLYRLHMIITPSHTFCPLQTTATIHVPHMHCTPAPYTQPQHWPHTTTITACAHRHTTTLPHTPSHYSASCNMHVPIHSFVNFTKYSTWWYPRPTATCAGVVFLFQVYCVFTHIYKWMNTYCNLH